MIFPSMAGGRGGPGSPLYTFVNAEAAAYVARFSVQPNNVFKAQIDTFFSSVKSGATSASNVYAKMDEMVLIGAPSAQALTLGMKNKFDLVLNAGAPVFTADQGVKANITSAYYIPSGGWTPATGGNNYTQNSACAGGYSRENTRIDNAALFGNGTGSAKLFLNPWRSGTDVAQYAINTATTPAGVSQTTARGLFGMNRTGSTAHQLWFNATKLFTQTIASNGVAADVRIITDGFQTGFRQMSFFFIGGGLTDAEYTDLANAINTLLTARGAN